MTKQTYTRHRTDSKTPAFLEISGRRHGSLKDAAEEERFAPNTDNLEFRQQKKTVIASEVQTEKNSYQVPTGQEVAHCGSSRNKPTRKIQKRPGGDGQQSAGGDA
ncbi:Hypothetical predicted protein [Cloeon dipterum]|uniref:Uncharacterized protein n=1 Tax=Cloeon dipterum TaxID=197152 RepID=A0A8S1DAM5_9INSE|nr:Hypothetical predicted protein [Cloeon dipterum]